MSTRNLPNASSSSPSIESMDVDDDELEEYNILGMHSPSDRERSGSFHGNSEGKDEEEDEEEESDEDDEDDDDDDDEDMSDESGSVEEEDPDPMEIQGHW